MSGTSKPNIALWFQSQLFISSFFFLTHCHHCIQIQYTDLADLCPQQSTIWLGQTSGDPLDQKHKRVEIGQRSSDLLWLSLIEYPQTPQTSPNSFETCMFSYAFVDVQLVGYIHVAVVMCPYFGSWGQKGPCLYCASGCFFLVPCCPAVVACASIKRLNICLIAACPLTKDLET